MQTLSNQQREKNGIERILSNSALRENLDDAQAEKLLNWGMAQISQLVATFDGILDQEQEHAADVALESLIDQIMLLMRSVNRLTFQLDTAARDETTQQAADDLIEQSASFYKQSEQAVLLLQTAVNCPAGWSAEAAFDFLFSFLEPAPNIEETE